MGLSQSFFAERFGITEHDLERYLSEALSAGGEYADRVLWSMLKEDWGDHWMPPVPRVH